MADSDHTVKVTRPETGNLLPVGTLFEGKYQILSLIGQGGMGVVYKAEHVLMGRKVAIKMLLSEMASDSEMFLRFKQEARAASNLSHPNIVATHDFGLTATNRAYLVMDYLDGSNLDDLILKYGPMGPARFCQYMVQACDALSHAHKRGIIHRDLKTSNIVLVRTDEGEEQIKIVDFGLAKVLGDAGEQHLTKTGLVVGSPMYMSPEQCQGAQTHQRSDIYSLGV